MASQFSDNSQGYRLAIVLDPRKIASPPSDHPQHRMAGHDSPFPFLPTLAARILMNFFSCYMIGTWINSKTEKLTSSFRCFTMFHNFCWKFEHFEASKDSTFVFLVAKGSLKLTFAGAFQGGPNGGVCQLISGASWSLEMQQMQALQSSCQVRVTEIGEMKVRGTWQKREKNMEIVFWYVVIEWLPCKN